MAMIKQIEEFKSKYLRMAGFVEYVQQVLKLFTDFRNSGEEGQSQLPVKVEPVYTSYKDSVTAVDDAYKLSRASDYTQKIADEDDRHPEDRRRGRPPRQPLQATCEPLEDVQALRL